MDLIVVVILSYNSNIGTIIVQLYLINVTTFENGHARGRCV